MHGLADDESRGLISGHATLEEMGNAATRFYMRTITTNSTGESGVKNLGLTLTERSTSDVPELSHAYSLTVSGEGEKVHGHSE